MVDIKRKKLIIWASITIVVLLVSAGAFFGYKYITENDNESVEIPQAQTVEEITRIESTNQKFNNLLEIANSKDVEVKLVASYEFAKSTENNTSSRLDAYRLCIQSAQELSDIPKEDTCYQEATALANTLPESNRAPWLKYLDEVKSGNVTDDGTDDGSQ